MDTEERIEIQVNGVDIDHQVDIPVDWFNVNQLPHELLIYIFSFLTIDDLYFNASRVCNLWHDLSADSSLWTFLDFEAFQFPEDDIIQIVKRAFMLDTIVLVGTKQVDCILREVSLNCRNVKAIALRFCDVVSETSLKELSQNCLFVCYVDLEGSKLDISPGSSVFSEFKSLFHLNLSHCTGFDDIQLIYIAEKCHHLYFININGISHITDYGMVQFLTLRGNSIKHLIVDGEQLTDRAYSLLSLCKSLTEFKVFFTEQMTDTSLKSLVKLSLSSLMLRKGVQLTPSGLTKFFSNGSFSQLTTLQLGECSQLDDKVLHEVSKTCHILSCLVLQWCWEVTDAGICDIVSSCLLLDMLDLIGLVQLNGHSLIDIPNKLTKLRYLSLEQCNSIDDNILHELADKMPSVIIIDYWGDCVSSSCHDSSDK